MLELLKLLIIIFLGLLFICFILFSILNKSKNKFFIVLLILILFVISGCSKVEDESTIEYATVTFYTNNNYGHSYQRKVVLGELVNKPEDPYKENYIFESWCMDIDLNYNYNFSLPVNCDFTLYAKYRINIDVVKPKVEDYVTLGTVKVIKYNFKKVLGFLPISDLARGSGSGVIFYEDDNYYYALTNNHVAIHDEDYDYAEYIIYDNYGLIYNGELYARNAEYDLAIIYFKKKMHDLNIINLAASNPDVKDDVISVSYPGGGDILIDFGTLSYYQKGSQLSCTERESNVRFDIMNHTGYCRPGSSGGALVNADLELIGIHYASNSGDEFEYGMAIPIMKVKEFLNQYFWS